MVDSTIHARPDATSGVSGPLPSLSVRPCGLSDRPVRFARPGLAEVVQPRLRPGLASQSGQLTAPAEADLVESTI